MVTGPGHGKPAGAAGHGHLRASHADREQVVEILKAAFVQGRLTKDELDARAGQAFAARTYADLAAVTTDLPGGPPGVRPARAPAGRPMSAAKAGKWMIIATAVAMVLSFLGGAWLFLLFTPFYFMALAFLTAELAASRQAKRSRHRQLPPGGSTWPRRPAAPGPWSARWL